MFNDKPRFINSTDVINIINSHPIETKEVKSPIIIKKQVQEIPKPIVEEVIEPVSEIKIEDPVCENYKFRYAGDDIPWLY